MTLPEASLYSPLKLMMLEALPEDRWSLVIDMAERSKSGGMDGDGEVTPTTLVGVADASGVLGLGVAGVVME